MSKFQYYFIMYLSMFLIILRIRLKSSMTSITMLYTI